MDLYKCFPGGEQTANSSLKIEAKSLAETLVTTYQDQECHFRKDVNLEECKTQNY